MKTKTELLTEIAAIRADIDRHGPIGQLRLSLRKLTYVVEEVVRQQIPEAEGRAIPVPWVPRDSDL